MKKRILILATGGTIASRYTEDGLSPAITAEELISYVPSAKNLCNIETIQPFSLDSTNVGPDEWITITGIIERKYDSYDGFVICHGTDTMAYTAAALSYLIRNNKKPVVVTGAQKPIDLTITDAKTNLLDSIRFACDDRAWGVCIVFDGQAIAGTRAKKERSKSFNAFSSINFPPVAIIQENRIAFYIDDKENQCEPLKIAHDMDTAIYLHKLIPGENGEILKLMIEKIDAVIIESFGVGGLPNYGDESYYKVISDYINAGKIVVMATQVVHEGSDMSVYEVGKKMKSHFNLPESYDMTLEACVTKTMWALSMTNDQEEFTKLFYTPVNHDMLLGPKNITNH
ncbi:MAG: asparaginase [Lachnospiraceae bacterium]|nr:asparaginase [Lachnospiraceae bacterium]